MFIVIRPEAELEIQDAYIWYEIQQNGLGDDFLLCLEAALSKIKRAPEMYPMIYKEVRRCLIKRFPYGIFYMVDELKVVIIAVFHCMRNPKEWKSRI